MVYLLSRPKPSFMARQKGVLKITGPLGNLSFFEDKRYGPIVRRKGGPSREQIQEAASCAVVRQNNAEFGAASRAGKLLRHSLYPLITLCGDHSLNHRVQKKLLALLKQDHRHQAGKRLLLKEQFKNFGVLQLNEACKAETFFVLPVKRMVEAGRLVAEAGVRGKGIEGKAATHFKVVSVAALVDFTAGREVHEVRESGIQALGEGDGTFRFIHNVRGRGVWFHGVCIVFYQQVNGKPCLLQEEGLKAGVVEWVEV